MIKKIYIYNAANQVWGLLKMSVFFFFKCHFRFLFFSRWFGFTVQYIRGVVQRRGWPIGFLWKSKVLKRLALECVCVGPLYRVPQHTEREKGKDSTASDIFPPYSSCWSDLGFIVVQLWEEIWFGCKVDLTWLELQRLFYEILISFV